ncbi:MAG TPA: GNAT family N-acetyltransferase [Rhizomicrobium sp.]
MNGRLQQNVVGAIAVDGDRGRAPTGGTRSLGSGLAAEPSGRFIVHAASDLRSFAGLWPDLSNLARFADARAYPFQCRDHLEIWLETIGSAADVRPFFAKVSDAAGEPLMLVPLGLRRQAGIRILEFLDCGVADYNAPVLYRAATQLSPAEARALWAAVCRAAPRFDVAVLNKMPERVEEFSNPLYALATHPCPESGHYIPLDGVPAETLQSKHDSKETRRRRARLSEVGEVRLRIAHKDVEVEEVFPVFLRQKSAQYREKTGSEGFDVPGQRAYYLSLARRLVNRGVELAYLRVGADIVATAWCLIAGRRYYYMMCAHEGGAWGKFGTGRLLLEDLVERAQREGLEAFDLGIGDESYKLRWKQMALSLADAREPATARGRLYCAAIAAREAMRNRLPPPLRNAAKMILRKAGPGGVT